MPCARELADVRCTPVCGPQSGCGNRIPPPAPAAAPEPTVFPTTAPPQIAPALPPDVVVDDDDEEEEDSEPVLSSDPGESSAKPPKDLFQRAKSILGRNGIDCFAECGTGLCWLSVPSVDADRAVRLLSADPALAPFARRSVEVVENMDSRVLRSLSRSVAERAARVLREHGIDPMVEDHAGVFELWVDRSVRDVAMQALRAEPQLRVYVAKRKYGRDREARPRMDPK